MKRRHEQFTFSPVTRAGEKQHRIGANDGLDRFRGERDERLRIGAKDRLRPRWMPDENDRPIDDSRGEDVAVNFTITCKPIVWIARVLVGLQKCVARTGGQIVTGGHVRDGGGPCGTSQWPIPP